MFFWTAKILWVLIRPLTLLGLLMAAGLALRCRWQTLGGRVLGAGVALFLILGFAPIGPNLLVWLETQYTRPNLPPGVDGIIVLGGMFDTYLSHETGQVVSNDNMERMTAFVELARRYPEAKLVFSGGAGSLRQTTRKEADDAKDYLEAIGFPPERVIFERESRNTFENAMLSKKLAQPKEGEMWVLITSASHMRRAKAVFDRAGWPVVPYPVDPDTALAYDWRAWPIDFLGNHSALDTATKELIGYVVYGITGKSS